MIQVTKMFFLLIFAAISMSYSQSVSGRLIDQNKNNVSANLKLYISSKEYTTTSGSNGQFVFNNITGVEKEQLPAGYSITENFPNPFNPKTRIGFTLPNSGSVRVEVYNTLGQKVKTIEEKNFSAGNGYIDLEMNGLSNGVYIAKITLDNKYSIIRKMMLLYGSQHLNLSGYIGGMESGTLSKGNDNTADTKIDSLVVEGNSLYKKVFKSLPALNATGVSLGELIVITPCAGIPNINYEGKTYNTVRIGNQCWLKENLDVGKMIDGSDTAKIQAEIEKYCYNNQSSNCTKYGGLYTWNEAMQNSSEENAQGICPGGWHIPSAADLDTLIRIVKGNSNAIKEIGEGNGNNSSGFSGLLAGYYRPLWGVYFSSLNQLGTIWTSTSRYPSNAEKAVFSNASVDFTYYNEIKSYGYSIRCILNKDSDSLNLAAPNQLYSPIDQSINVSQPIIFKWGTCVFAESYIIQISTDTSFNNIVYSNNNITNNTITVNSLGNSIKYYWRVKAVNKYGSSGYSRTWNFTTSSGTDISCPGTPTVTDTRDGRIKIYNTVKIGKQCWLKENLDVGSMIKLKTAPENNYIIEKYCYNNDTANCNKYGGLYRWKEAMQYDLKEKVQGICPDGWHIPTRKEYETLAMAFAINRDSFLAQGELTGNNLSGFSALLGGSINRNYGEVFIGIGFETYFFTSTGNTTNSAYYYGLISSSRDFFGSYSDTYNWGFSIRCIKNE